MKSFIQVVKEDTEYTTSVNEGWGTALGTLMKFIPGMAGVGMVTNHASRALSVQNLMKLFQNAKLKKYIDDECAKTIKEETRKNKNLTAALPSGFASQISRWWNKSDISEKMSYWSEGSINKNVYIFYDTDHIQSVKVCLYDTAYNTYRMFPIKPPKTRELGFYKESYMPTVFNADSIFDL